MLYVIKEKFYILVSGYYKEVDIDKKGSEFVVKAKKDSKIEAGKVKEFTTINVEDAYKKAEKSKSIAKSLDNM